jgi:hypothetical protein
MSRQPYRAPLFVHPDLDVGEPAGLRLTNTGALAMTDREASVRQAVMLLLTTHLGERVMRPDYGCELDQLTFEPADDTAAGLAMHFVRRALERWEPRVEIVELDADRNRDDPSRLDVWLRYRVRPTSREQEVIVPVQLMHPGA